MGVLIHSTYSNELSPQVIIKMKTGEEQDADMMEQKQLTLLGNNYTCTFKIVNSKTMHYAKKIIWKLIFLLSCTYFFIVLALVNW